MSALDPQTIAQLSATLPRSELVPILRAFLDDLTRLARDFDAAAAAAREEPARRAAHALAGTAAGIGAMRLEAVARRAMAPGAEAPALALEMRAEAEAALAEIAATLDRLAQG
ncbi:Hpt domain-containing protein [Falsiroseomonas sp. HW251]|uniref:Hpt domain-containing protein n=1 Tax=Falsiroseomonas sp. HW251 TaxID=3390998 RepID=UPI003D31E363